MRTKRGPAGIDKLKPRKCTIEISRQHWKGEDRQTTTEHLTEHSPPAHKHVRAHVSPAGKLLGQDPKKVPPGSRLHLILSALRDLHRGHDFALLFKTRGPATFGRPVLVDETDRASRCTAVEND